MNKCVNASGCEWWYCRTYNECLLSRFNARGGELPKTVLVQNSTPVLQYGPFQKQHTAYPPTKQKKKPKKSTPPQTSSAGLVVISRRRQIYNKTNGICYLCGENVEYRTFTIDHFIPRVLGGTNDIENLFATHGPCNWKKGRELVDFPHHLINKQSESQ